MKERKRDKTHDATLEHIARNVLIASASNERAAEEASVSPFLYARVRARIAAETARREAAEWRLTVMTVLRRALPVMALATLLVIIFFGFAAPHSLQPTGAGVDALFGADATEFELATSAEHRTITNDEVLSAILEDGQEAAK